MAAGLFGDGTCGRLSHRGRSPHRAPYPLRDSGTPPRPGPAQLHHADRCSRTPRRNRELSLLLRRPPGHEAYPGDIFSVLVVRNAARRVAELDPGAVGPDPKQLLENYLTHQIGQNRIRTGACQLCQHIESDQYGDTITIAEAGNGSTAMIQWFIAQMIIFILMVIRNINYMPVVKFFARLDLYQICLFLDGH